jgi:molybdate transport system substrate-binding protein
MNHTKLSALLLVTALCLVALPLAAAPQPSLLVSAAASLTDVLTSLKAPAEQAVGMPIQFNFGGSGALRQQIEQGAPVDVFFSAAAEDMDKLAAGKLIVQESRQDLLSNSIVLVGDISLPKPESRKALENLLSGARILAIGNPDSVPAGRYAVQALKNLGLYSLVDGRMVLGGNVRQVLQFVQSGSAPLGIVFSTDALSVKDSSVAVLYAFPASSLTTPVVYPIAVVAASVNSRAAAAFIAFLRGPEAWNAFAAAGFTAP